MDQEETRIETHIHGPVQGFVQGEHNTVTFIYQQEKERQKEPSSPIWSVPHRRNAFFTGREDILHNLWTAFGEDYSHTTVQAISGLGGVGKTQIALEYAYRHQKEYSSVLWVNAETRESLFSDYSALANRLNLAEKDAEDQRITVEALKHWLDGQIHWLLILDNVEDMSVIDDALPTVGKGHVLLTTRSQAQGTLAQGLNVDQMTENQAALFLLRRAKKIGRDALLDQASTTDHLMAENIATVLGGLPLALDQAAAYIEETRCSLSDYFQLYQSHQASLLKRRGKFPTGHSESVTTTFTLTLDKLKSLDHLAVDILSLCAFLHPDAIPETIITDGATHLGIHPHFTNSDPLIFNESLETLLNYSLIRRNSMGKELTIHRLVQEILKAQMSEATLREWLEWTLRALDAVFPRETEDIAVWPNCERYILHVQACLPLIEEKQLVHTDIGSLFQRAGVFRFKRGHYHESESLLKNALSIREQVLGPAHLDVAISLIALAKLYTQQHKYEQAKALFQRALSIREQFLGTNHILTAQTLSSLAMLYYYQGRYAEAESLLEQALAINENLLGPNHLETASILNDLATLYKDQSKDREAELLFLRSLAICERLLPPVHPDVADVYYNLGSFYSKTQRYAESEPLLKKALAIDEQLFGLTHPNVASDLNDLALVCHRQNKDGEAEPLYLRALAIYEEAFDPNHPYVATCLNNLGRFLDDQGRYTEAELLLQRALDIRQQVREKDHPSIAESLDNLGALCVHQGRYPEAESFHRHALAIYEQTLQPTHPDVLTCLQHLAHLYKRQGRYSEAEPLYRRVLSAREQMLGSQHPDTLVALRHYVTLLHDMDRDEEARSLEEHLRQQTDQERS